MAPETAIMAGVERGILREVLFRPGRGGDEEEADEVGMRSGWKKKVRLVNRNRPPLDRQIDIAVSNARCGAFRICHSKPRLLPKPASHYPHADPILTST